MIGWLLTRIYMRERLRMAQAGHGMGPLHVELGVRKPTLVRREGRPAAPVEPWRWRWYVLVIRAPGPAGGQFPLSRFEEVAAGRWAWVAVWRAWRRGL